MLRRAVILLLLTWLGCWPVWCLPEWDGTEGRRVQIALEMLQNGDWMVPALGGQPTWAKPPLHYWVLASFAHLFGSGQIALRLPSVLSVFAAALTAMELLRRWYGSRAGWVAALGIVLSPMVMIEWPTAEIDPLFASLTATSIWCLATGVARERRGLVVVSGLIGGLALLEKGPPYFLFAFGAYLVWWRRRGFGLLLLHLVPMLLVALAYYGPLWLWWIDPSALLAVASEESVGRISLFEWQHLISMPGFWVRAILVQVPFVFWCFWEWRGARNARMDANDLTLRMCSGGAVIAIVLLTMFPGRPTRYLLPNVLLFTFAVAPAVAHFAEQRSSLPKFVSSALNVVGVLGALTMIVAPFVSGAGVAILALALVASLAPFAVRSPGQVVACCLVLPLVGAWTVGLERTLRWPHGPRDRLQGASLLRRELDARGAEIDLSTYGHVDSPLLLAAGLSPLGDERAERLPTSGWLLHEDGQLVPQVYVERLRLSLPLKTFVVCERTDRRR